MLATVLMHLALTVAPPGDGVVAPPGAEAQPPSPSPTPSWETPVEVATGRGERGPWRQNDSRYDYVDDPAVAFTSDGELVVAWVDQAGKAVLLQRYGRDGVARLPDPVDVSRSPDTFSWLPRVVAAPGRPQRLFVLWQEIIFSGGSHGGDILFARSDDGGASFATPLNLSRSVGGDGKGRITREHWDNGSLDLAVAGDDVVHVAWTEYDGPLWHARSSDGGRSFSTPRQVAGSMARPARAPALAVTADGRVHLAYTLGDDREPARADIHVMTSDDGGRRFAAPLVVAPGAPHSDAPRLALGPDDALHLAWAESTAGPFAPRRIRHARSVDGGRRFGTSVALPLPGGAAGAAFPQLAIGRCGEVVVAWESWPDTADGRPRGLGLAISHDGGRSFPPPGTVPGSIDPAGGTQGSHQGLLTDKLALDAQGGIALVNSSLRTGAGSRVWALRGHYEPRC